MRDRYNVDRALLEESIQKVLEDAIRSSVTLGMREDIKEIKARLRRIEVELFGRVIPAVNVEDDG